MRKELTTSHEQERYKIIKALEDVKKFREVYKTMLE